MLKDLIIEPERYHFGQLVTLSEMPRRFQGSHVFIEIKTPKINIFTITERNITFLKINSVSRLFDKIDKYAIHEHTSEMLF